MQSTPHDQTVRPAAQEAGEITMVEIINTLLRHRRTMLLVPLVLALGVLAWTLLQPSLYVASASFMPQASDTRGGGGAMALAQQFGVSLAPAQPGQSPEFYADLLRSNAILRQTVETEYRLPSEDGAERRGTLIDFYDIEEEPREALREAQERLMEHISASVSRETGVVRLDVALADPALAEQVTRRLLDLLNDFNLEVRQSAAREEGRFISGRIEEAAAALRAAEDGVESFLRQNHQFQNAPELRFEHERLERQVAMRQEVYTSLLRSEEQAQIDAVRDTPVITVIDAPEGTAEPASRGLAVKLLLAIIAGLLIGATYSFIDEQTRRGRAAQDPDYREMEGLARELWRDLRQPGRWMRRERGQGTPGRRGVA